MRQIVDRKVQDEFLEQVVARAKQFKLGDPLDPETTLPAMVTAEHRDRVMGYIDKGKGEGAKLLAGGSRTLARRHLHRADRVRRPRRPT